MSFIDWAAILGALALTIYFYFKNKSNYFKKLNIFFVKSSFGDLKHFVYPQKWIALYFQQFYDLSKKKKVPAIGIFQFHKPLLLLTEPELIKQCLIRDFSSFHDRGFLKPEVNLDPLLGHLFLLEGTKWRNLRMKLSPTFTSGKIKMMFSTIKDKSEELVKYLNEHSGEDFEVRDLFARLLTDIIAACAFGVECNCLKNPDAEFRQWGRKIFKQTRFSNLKRVLDFLYRPLRILLKIKLVPVEVEKYFIEMVEETIKYREENNIKKNDFMQLLIELKNNKKLEDDEGIDEEFLKDTSNDGKALTILECAAQAFVFFIAGFETSSTTMSFAIYELTRNPEIQLRVQEEIDSVMKKHSALTYEALGEMHYLEWVINETLRKYPPVPILNRATTKPVDMKCGINQETVHLPEGVKIFIPAYALHNDPEYFPEPEKFKPERFNDENKSKRPHIVHLPFGEGPRNCIGARFGLVQTKVGLAVLLHNFNFKTCSKTPISLKFDALSFIAKSQDDLFIRIEKRK